METIIDIKDGRAGNISALLFLCGLSGFVIWAVVHWHLGWVAALFASVVIGIWLLVSMIFAYRIFRPKRRTLRFQDDVLVWSVKSGSAPPSESRAQLASIRKLRFIHQPSTCEGPDFSQPSLIFVFRDGSTKELPGDFLAGTYRRRIEAAFRRRIPGLLIEDLNAKEIN